MQTEKNKRGRPRKWNTSFVKQYFPEVCERHLLNYTYAMVAWRDIYKTDKMKLFCDRGGRIKISILAELGRVEDEKFRIFLIQWIAEGMVAKEKFNVKMAAFILRDIRLKHNSIESFMETDS